MKVFLITKNLLYYYPKRNDGGDDEYDDDAQHDLEMNFYVQ